MCLILVEGTLNDPRSYPCSKDIKINDLNIAEGTASCDLPLMQLAVTPSPQSTHIIQHSALHIVETASLNDLTANHPRTAKLDNNRVRFVVVTAVTMKNDVS
jgi:hypothetical protein